MKKRFLSVLLIMLVAMLINCKIDTNSENEDDLGRITLAWDAPEGATDDYEYEIYIADYPNGEEELLGTTSKLEYTVILPDEGDYKFSVRTKRTIDEVISFSDFLSSNTGGSPEPWYVSYNKSEGKPQQIIVE